MSGSDDTRDGVPLTNLDQPLFDGADATKGDLVEYLDAVRDRIVEAWLPMAERLAGRFRSRGESYEDLRQVAALGLVKAVDRYDPCEEITVEIVRGGGSQELRATLDAA